MPGKQIPIYLLPLWHKVLEMRQGPEAREAGTAPSGLCTGKGTFLGTVPVPSMKGLRANPVGYVKCHRYKPWPLHRS